VVLLSDESIQHPQGLPSRSSNSEECDPLRPKVLVVDDEKMLADTTATILYGAGFNAKTAYDGWEALDLAISFRPDYLLTDIVMPRMNGIEMAIAVTNMLPKTKILLFSGQAGVSDILRESKARGYEFSLLAKPVDPLTLIEVLRKINF
jgi:CheY-like chemotaxis protein